jgi:hypothetical protein
VRLSEDQKCDQWIDYSDHRCQNRWQHTIVLGEDTHVIGHTMFGTYPAGSWHFCNMHNRIFQRDRDER